MVRQPWYKEGRRPQRLVRCSLCGANFRDHRTADEALLQAIFGEPLCPKCIAKRDEIMCTYCNKGVPKERAIYFNGEPRHKQCLPASQGGLEQWV